jgi:hypothetical protein
MQGAMGAAIGMPKADASTGVVDVAAVVAVGVEQGGEKGLFATYSLLPLPGQPFRRVERGTRTRVAGRS